MKDNDKTKEQLITELAELRQRVAELEALEAEHKRTEESLRESEREKILILDSSLENIVHYNKDLTVEWANRTAAQLAGESPQDLVGRYCYEIWHQRSEPCEGCHIAETLKTGEPRQGDRDTPDGRAFLVRSVPVLDDNDEVIGAISVGVDITERKRAEETLKESEEKYRTIFENVSEVIIRLDRYGKIVDINERAEDCFGYKPEEVIGKNFARIGVLSPKDLPEMVKLFGEIIRGKRAPFIIELEAKHKDGSPVLIEVNSKLVEKDGKKEGFVTIVRDITEHKQAEEALQAEKNKLRSVIDALEDSLTVQDKDYNIIYQSEPTRIIFGDRVGEKCYRVYEGKNKLCDGCPVEKAFRDGKSHTSERKVVTPSGETMFWENTANPVRDARGEVVSCLEVGRNITERKRMEEALQESREALRKMFESVTDGILVIDLNGVITEVNKELVKMHGFSSKNELLGKSAFELVAPRDHEKIAKNMRKALKGGTTRGVEYTLLRADGSEFPGELSTSLLKDTSGNPVGHVTISRDITERKQAEEREKELQQELYLSSRLASIGELAAGVAHQINNPLTGVLGFSQRLLRKSTDQEVSQDLERIYTEAERATKVVQNLLTFARRRQPHKQYSDINEILQSALELRAYELKTSNIEVITDLAPDLPQIMIDFHQIQEVFLNIILNAEQVMTEANSGGRLTIKTEERKEYIRTTFTDDGTGIPAEHLDKIFDPFFSTKGERGGTGLGLSVCHGIITEHGGRIYAKSKPGKGATFFVELPVNTGVAERG